VLLNDRQRIQIILQEKNMNMWMTMIRIEHNHKDSKLVASKYALQRRFVFAISQKGDIEPQSFSYCYQRAFILFTQMDMIFEAMNARFSDHEKKVGRKLMEIEHRFDAKYITMSEDLIDIKSKTGSNPRLSKAEDEIKDLRRELHVCHTVHFIFCMHMFLHIHCCFHCYRN
jgi:hypothetical protein